jgi:putative tryptophan/tyrosine transport system substrate-binding protein
VKRREFISMLGSAATLPFAARGQQSAMPLIGVLSGASPATFALVEAAFRRGLADVGFGEGKNLGFEYRWAQDQFDRLPALAVDLVHRSPAVIATHTLPAALAVKAPTSVIPIVFVVGEDPIKAGLVMSLNRPSANITGVTNFMNVLGAKRLELASEITPKARVDRIAGQQQKPKRGGGHRRLDHLPRSRWERDQAGPRAQR